MQYPGHSVEVERMLSAGVESVNGGLSVLTGCGGGGMRVRSPRPSRCGSVTSLHGISEAHSTGGKSLKAAAGIGRHGPRRMQSGSRPLSPIGSPICSPPRSPPGSPRGQAMRSQSETCLGPPWQPYRRVNLVDQMEQLQQMEKQVKQQAVASADAIGHAINDSPHGCHGAGKRRSLSPRVHRSSSGGGIGSIPERRTSGPIPSGRYPAAELAVVMPVVVARDEAMMPDPSKGGSLRLGDRTLKGGTHNAAAAVASAAGRNASSWWSKPTGYPQQDAPAEAPPWQQRSAADMPVAADAAAGIAPMPTFNAAAKDRPAISVIDNYAVVG